MKTQFTISIIIVMALSSIAASPSPETIGGVPKMAKQVSPKLFGEFAFYRLHHQGKDGVTTVWGMNSEAGITCYTVQRTYFDPTDPYSPWDDIGVVPCTSSRSYTWRDGNVLSGFISYRIVAVGSGNNNNMVSETLTIRVGGH